MKPKLLVIVGPTASGKSDLAVFLARKFGGEIVSADSRQVYRGLDIGTGKITKKEMHGIPHYLLDVALPARTFTVADYKKLAEQAIHDIRCRKKLPILVGGTGFYIEAIVDDLMLPEVNPDPELRKRLDRKTPEQLHALLQKLDPRRAAAIDPQNPVRLIRAIEIARAIGRVPRMKKRARFDTLILGLAVPRSELASKIKKRLAARMRQGMVAEARRLHAHGLSYARMERLGLEYRYLARFLQRKSSKAEMLAELERGIGAYAKRQMTWFRRDKRVRWIDPRDRAALMSAVTAFQEQAA